MKKNMVVSILFIIVFSHLIFAAGKVQVVRSKAYIYKSKGAKGKKLYTAKKGEALSVIKRGGSTIKVQSSTGVVGWVKRSSVKAVSKKIFQMDEVKVLGYLENPQAVYILDTEDPNFKPIQLNRSFRDKLKGNIDKETNQRMYDPNLKPEK